jgi:hypothetical protein
LKQEGNYLRPLEEKNIVFLESTSLQSIGKKYPMPTKEKIVIGLVESVPRKIEGKCQCLIKEKDIRTLEYIFLWKLKRKYQMHKKGRKITCLVKREN